MYIVYPLVCVYRVYLDPPSCIGMGTPKPIEKHTKKKNQPWLKSQLTLSLGLLNLGGLRKFDFKNQCDMDESQLEEAATRERVCVCSKM